MNTGIELPPTPNPPQGRGTFSRVIFHGRTPAKNDAWGIQGVDTRSRQKPGFSLVRHELASAKTRFLQPKPRQKPGFSLVRHELALAKTRFLQRGCMVTVEQPFRLFPLS